MKSLNRLQTIIQEIPARLHKLARVVAVRAANDDDDIALAGEIDGGDLPIFRRSADRIDKANDRLRESPLDEIDNVPHFDDRLRRLRCDANPGMWLQREHVGVFQHDIEVIQIPRQATHFDVAALPDNHGMVAVADERPHRLVRHVHQRARRLDHLEAASPRFCQSALGRAMRRHHHRRCVDVGQVVGDGDAPGL